MAITAAKGGDVSFTVVGDGASTTVTLTLAAIATLLGYSMPAAITAVDLVDFSLPAGSAVVTCKPSVANGGDSVLLTFSAALTNNVNYSIVLRFWA